MACPSIAAILNKVKHYLDDVLGSNYCEADDAVSKKDFRNKIGTCRKEARETKYWFRMIAEAEPEMRNEARALWQEAKELHLIFASILRK